MPSKGTIVPLCNVSGANGFYNVRYSLKIGHSEPLWRTGTQTLPPTQLNIFNHSGLHTVVRDMKEAFNAEVKSSGRSRDQVLDRVNELAKRHRVSLNGKGELSKDLFEKWLNPEDESRVPGIKGIMLLCAALETVGPLEALAASQGGRVIGQEDVKMLEWAKTYQKTKELRKRMRRLEEDL